MRYTEYHGGVAVIKDKNRLKEAMEKLAKLEDAEEQSRLVELPCAIGEYVYQIVKTGASETYTIMHEGHEYSREVPFLGIMDCKFSLKLMDEFGKTVFPTYEAAQEALWRMEKAEGRNWNGIG